MKYFKLEELTKSTKAEIHGIDNSPSPTEIVALQALVENVLDPARHLLGLPIQVTSGYRCKRLNTLVKGSPTSQHMKGEAADLVCANNAKLFDIIKTKLPFDQLIWEKGNDRQPAWVHVSFRKDGENRKKVLRIR